MIDEERSEEEAQEQPVVFPGMEVPADTEESEEELGGYAPAPSPGSFIVPKVEAAAERTGRAARGLLSSIGQRIEAPGPPDDDLSDLFEGPDMDKDNDVYIKDLVTVSEEDVFGDGGEDMSDILEVTDEDIMGEEDPLGEEPSGGQAKTKYRRTSLRRSVPAGLSGMQV